MPAPIFVVDSSPAVRRMVEQISAPEGFEVVGFHDGPAALEAARRNSPSLIIADYHLDNMTFSGFCKEINKLDHLTETFVISLIDSADHPDENHLRTLGVKAFIKKPFQSEELLDVLKSFQQKSVTPSASQGLKRRTWPPSADSEENEHTPTIGVGGPVGMIDQPKSPPVSPPSPVAAPPGPESAMKGLFDQLLYSVSAQAEKRLADIVPQAIEGKLATLVPPMIQKELQTQASRAISQESLTSFMQPLVTQTMPALLKQELADSGPMIKQTVSDQVEPLIKTILDQQVRSQVESLVVQHLPSIVREHLTTIDQLVRDEVHRVTQAQVTELTDRVVRTTAERTVEQAVQQIVPGVAELQIKAELTRLLESTERSSRTTN